MFKKRIYGKHSEYGEWLEKIFRTINGDCQEIVASYQKTQVAKEAAEDREYIEKQAIRWFILALYGFYFFQVLQRKDYAEAEGQDGDQELIQQRSDILFRAMTTALGDETPTRICTSIVQRWVQGQGGLTPEYVAAEALASNFDFSLTSGRSEVDFKEANTRFFQVVKDKRITPALYEFLGDEDPDVKRVLELAAQGYDGLNRKAVTDEDWQSFLASTEK